MNLPTRTFVATSLLLALVMACGGGTEPTNEDLTGLWRVQISRILAPPAEEGFCSIGWTMAVEPSGTSPDTFFTRVPLTTQVVCGNESSPWGLDGGTLVIAKQGDQVTISRGLGLAIVGETTLKGSKLTGHVGDNLYPGANFDAVRTGGPDPNLAPVSLVVEALGSSIQVGDTLRIFATAFDGYGNLVTSPSPTLTSTHPSVATIDEDGLAHGVEAGTTIIVAALAGLRDSLTLTVSPP